MELKLFIFVLLAFAGFTQSPCTYNDCPVWADQWEYQTPQHSAHQWYSDRTHEPVVEFVRYEDVILPPKEYYVHMNQLFLSGTYHNIRSYPETNYWARSRTSHHAQWYQ